MQPSLTPWLTLLALGVLCYGKPIVVVDDIGHSGPIYIRFFDMSNLSKPTQVGYYALSNDATGLYKEGCVDSTSNQVFIVLGVFQKPDSYVLQKIDAKTQKKTAEVPFTLKHPYGAIKCDSVSQEIVVMQPLKTQVDTVIFTVIDPKTGKTKREANVTDAKHPHEYWLDNQAYSSKSHEFVWQWIYSRGPLTGELTFVNTQTGVHKGLAYNIGYRELENIIYDSTKNLVYGTNTSNAAVFKFDMNSRKVVNVNSEFSSPDVIWVQGLVKWDVATNHWGNVAPLQRLVNYGPWDVGASESLDGKYYSNWGRNSSTTATHFNMWELDNSKLTISGPVEAFQVGPLRWFQWADLDV